MVSNKFSRGKRLRRTPPVCHPPPPPPPPPYPSLPTLLAADPGNPIVAWLKIATLPAIPPKPYAPIQQRNLAYHVYPHPSNDGWFRNLDQLRRRWHLFNGRRVIAIATAPELLPPDRIRSFLGPDADYIEIPNDPRLREAASFPTLLARLRNTHAHEATFYAHTKGATPRNHITEPLKIAIARWRNRSYHELLDNWHDVHQALRTHATVGTFKIDYSKIPGYKMQSPTGLRWGTWHYAGTFFWFRHDYVFRSPEWSAIPDDPFAAEMWLGEFIPSTEAATMNQTWNPQHFPNPNFYEPDAHPDPIDD